MSCVSLCRMPECPGRQLILHKVVLDSRDRDAAAYPNPNAYVLDIGTDVYDVVSMSLVVADVPFASYLVNATNSAVAFAVGSFTYVAALETGDYASPDDLAAELGAAMTAAAGSTNTTFTASYDPRTDGFVVAAPAQFSLVFGGAPGQPRGTYAPSCAARLLGFGPATYVATAVNGGAYAVGSAFRKDWHVGEYVVVHVDPATSGGNANANVSANPAVDRGFATLGPRPSALNFSRPDTIEKAFSPPIARLRKVRVAFLDVDGNPTDFQNQENRLELVLASLATRYNSGT